MFPRSTKNLFKGIEYKNIQVIWEIWAGAPDETLIATFRFYPKLKETK